MNKAIVYGLIPGFRFDGFKNDIVFERGVIISSAPQDIISKLLDSCSETVSIEDRKDIEGVQYTIKIETADSYATIDSAIKNIHSFVATLRIIKPIIAYPQYIFSYHYDADYYFLRVKSELDFCYAIDADVEMHKFPVELISDLFSIWQNIPQIIQNSNRIWRAQWLCEKSYLEKYNEFRILFFAMALESLFGTSDAELGFSLSLRTARFLSDDLDNRKRIFRELKDAYNSRSSIVHGLRKRLSNTEIRTAEICFRENVRLSLLKIMQNRKLIDMFDGPQEQYHEFLKTLEFN